MQKLQLNVSVSKENLQGLNQIVQLDNYRDLNDYLEKMLIQIFSEHYTNLPNPHAKYWLKGNKIIETLNGSIVDPMPPSASTKFILTLHDPLFDNESILTSIQEAFGVLSYWDLNRIVDYLLTNLLKDGNEKFDMPFNKTAKLACGDLHSDIELALTFAQAGDDDDDE